MNGAVPDHRRRARIHWRGSRAHLAAQLAVLLEGTDTFTADFRPQLDFSTTSQRTDTRKYQLRGSALPHRGEGALAVLSGFVEAPPALESPATG